MRDEKQAWEDEGEKGCDERKMMCWEWMGEVAKGWRYSGRESLSVGTEAT